jgi:putative acetyltransferase
MPFYERLGFTVVPHGLLSHQLRWLVDEERRRGLDTERRVLMRRFVAPTRAWASRVRPARQDDRVRMLEVWERSVRATHTFLSEADVVGLKPLVNAELESEAVGWWVLEVAAAVVGFLGFASETIESLFIDPDYRGRGGGTLLVEHAQRLAGGPLLVDVNEQNDAARRFYEARGFVVIGRSPTDSGGRPFPMVHMRQSR